MYTDKMRYTGFSGIDTQSMVEQLMKAESAKLYKFERSTQLLTWKQEAYRNTASKLQTFQNDFLSLTSGLKMRNPSTYNISKATAKISGTETNAVKITNSSGAPIGDYTLEIKALASKDQYVGSKEFGGEVKSSVDANVQNLRSGDNFTVNLDGQSKKITLNDDDIEAISNATPADKSQKFAEIMQSKLNTAYGSGKVTASNDGHKLVFSTNKGNSFSISEGSGRDTAITSANAFVPPTEDKQIGFSIKDADGNLKEIKVDLKKDITAADAVKEINKKLSDANVKSVSFSVGKDDKIVMSNLTPNADVAITNTESLSEIGFVDASQYPIASFTIEKKNIMGELGIASGTTNNLDTNRSAKDLFGSALQFDPDTKLAQIEINGSKIEIAESDTLGMFMDKVNSSDAGVKLSFDNISRKFSIESTETGSAAKIEMGQNFKDMMGFTSASKNASDARFIINGVETTRTSNNVDINGLKMTLNETTDPGKVININNSAETSTTLDNIKKFVEGYNNLISGLQDEVSTSRIRNSSGVAYQPLTDTEKDSMSESEVKLWEDKAKLGLLYRDDILSKVQSDLRTNIYKSVELSNGKKLSLYDIGITTSKNYNDGGKLVIDEAKLAKALQERPQDVTELFTKSSDYSFSDKTNLGKRMNEEGISERINDIINGAVGSNGTIAKRAGLKNTLSETTNDIYKQLKNETTRMTELRTYLYNKENYYYNMFSKMETAMTQSNNQMSYFQSMIG